MDSKPFNFNPIPPFAAPRAVAARQAPTGNSGKV
jgi:hypothetical protein